MTNSLDCIFLDLDGTILDGKLKHYNCYRDILIKDGGQPLDMDIYWDMKRSKIKRTIALERSFYKKSYEDFYKQWIDNIEKKAYLEYDFLKPDVIDTIQNWRSTVNRVFLITMRNNRENLLWQLAKLNIFNLFDGVFSCRNLDNVTKYDAIRDINFNTGLVIGDTEQDVELAKKCGIKCIGITNGLRDKSFIDADFFYQEIKDIDINFITQTITSSKV